MQEAEPNRSCASSLELVPVTASRPQVSLCSQLNAKFTSLNELGHCVLHIPCTCLYPAGAHTVTQANQNIQWLSLLQTKMLKRFLSFSHLKVWGSARTTQ